MSLIVWQILKHADIIVGVMPNPYGRGDLAPTMNCTKSRFTNSRYNIVKSKNTFTFSLGIAAFVFAQFIALLHSQCV